MGLSLNESCCNEGNPVKVRFFAIDGLGKSVHNVPYFLSRAEPKRKYTHLFNEVAKEIRPADSKREASVVLTIEIDPHHLGALRHLKNLTGAESFEALINQALALRGWAAEQKQNGRLVVALNQAKDSYVVLDLESLAGESAPSEPAVVADGEATAAA